MDPLEISYGLSPQTELDAPLLHCNTTYIWFDVLHVFLKYESCHVYHPERQINDTVKKTSFFCMFLKHSDFWALISLLMISPSNIASTWGIYHP